MSLASILALLALIGVLTLQTVAGVVALGDFSFQWPSALGNPGNQSLESAIAGLDLQALGLERMYQTPVDWANNVWIGPQGKALRAGYEGDGREIYLTLIKFTDNLQADEFFSSWMSSIDQGRRLGHLAINLPGIPGQGRIYRGYLVSEQSAYSAWQNENWVTIVQAPGAYNQAAPLARQVKELLAKEYQEGN